MLTSLSGFQIDMKNKYSLKALFILNKLNDDHLDRLNSTIIAPIHHNDDNHNDDVNLDTMYLDAQSITFQLQIDDTKWYTLTCGYKKDTISNVSEYLRSYSEYEDCWTEVYDYETNNIVNEYRSNIKRLLQTCFKKIKTMYKSTDIDMIESPWFYNIMKSFEQTTSLQTMLYVKNYINSIRSQLACKRHYESNLQLKMFNVWKEWYYNPYNINGYIKTLASKKY